MITTLPDSSIAKLIHDRWELVPLRIPTGWHVRWNGIEARRVGEGRYEINDSQDLFWAVRDDRDRSTSVDGGYYGEGDDGVFRICVLEPDWDHVTDTYETRLFDDFVDKLERCLLELAAR